MSMRVLSIVALLAGPSALWANYSPYVSSWSQVSPTPVVADGVSTYTVTVTGTDSDGYNDLRDMRVLFNFSEADMDPAEGRGYLGWGATDGDLTRFGGTWVLDDATGGGRWGYNSANWGGTTYITPVSASTTVTGSASGGLGTRTVTWTFQAKSAFAFNPVLCDADVWVADYDVNLGWQDSPNEFEVVAQSCAAYSATPNAPVLSNPTDLTVDVAIDPADSSTDHFLIKIDPPIFGKSYVQSDGSIGTKPTWKTKTGWGTTTVTGLLWDTTYTFYAQAYTIDGSTCLSALSGGSQLTTYATPLPIDPTQGTSFSPGVRGQNPYRSVSTSGYGPLWDLAIGASGRGLAGGLDADTYDWRDINSGANWGLRGGYFTTLEFLQYARDHDAFPQLTANAFGGGYQDPGDGTFICQYDNPEGLAADWVRYTNFILPSYRQGDEGSLTGEDLRVYNSIADWGGKAKLLPAGETSTPAVQYWEIGNEPELGGFPTFLSNHHLNATDYRDRYASIAAAMLAVDPTLKLGPCLMDPGDGSSAWLDALAADPSIPVDFVSYHPYYNTIKVAWGNPTGMATGLRDYKAWLRDKVTGIHNVMTARGRTNYDLMASEWNPVNWDAPGIVARSQAAGLAVAEGVFSYAEDDVLAAHYWEQAHGKLGVKLAYEGLRDHMGDTILAAGEDLGLAPENYNWRVYVTCDSSAPDTINVWGLNFNEDDPVDVDLYVSDPRRLVSATLKHMGQPGDDGSGGDSSLTDDAGMAWDSQDVTAGFDLADFTFTLEDAEITLLVLVTERVPQVDFDRDGDVDMDDFGWFQECMTGDLVPQNDPFCLDARTDGDTDVDDDDLNAFLGCLSGANVLADPDCLN